MHSPAASETQGRSGPLIFSVIGPTTLAYRFSPIQVAFMAVVLLGTEPEGPVLFVSWENCTIPYCERTPDARSMLETKESADLAKT